MDENQKYEIIKKLVDTNGNKKTAALKIGCSDRHINRLIKGYQEKGKAFFIHGNHGRQPAITLSSDTKQLILDLYRNKYYDCNLTHYAELLQQKEHIRVAISTITSILRKEFILSPKANRSTKKAVKKELKTLQSKTKSKKEIAIIQSSILNLEDSHPRRPRCAYFGEMLQMDASLHLWFGDSKTQLHIAVDDATGQIVGAYFDTQETLNGYYHVLHQILSCYGIPYQFFTDRRTVFEYKKKHETSVEKDTFTQFGYACKQLGIDIRTSSVAQAKGRVERMFGTLQSRLPIELRLANVSSIEEANEFLDSYIKKFNKQFALPIDSIKSVFETQPDNNKINLTLAVLSPRKIDNGSCLKYQNEYYLPVNSQGIAVHHRKNTTAMVIRAFNGELYSCIGEQTYVLEMLPKHKLSSKAFDLAVLPKAPKKKYIPPMNHPWKQASFERYLKKQAHRQEQQEKTA
jgi:transposase